MKTPYWIKNRTEIHKYKQSWTSAVSEKYPVRIYPQNPYGITE